MILIETILWLRVREDSVQIFLETNCFFLSNCVRSGDGCEESENTRNMIAEFEKVFIVLEKQVCNTKAKN